MCASPSMRDLLNHTLEFYFECDDGRVCGAGAQPPLHMFGIPMTLEAVLVMGRVQPLQLLDKMLAQVWCSVLQCGAVWCSVLQCDAHVLQCVRSCSGDGQGTAVAAHLHNIGASAVCSVLQCVAVCRSVLQCVACVSLFYCACGCVQGARVAPRQNISAGVCVSICIYVHVYSQIFMHIYTDLNI